MTEGMEDSSIGLVVPPRSASPTDSTAADTGQAPEEKREEMVAGGEGGEEGAEGEAEGGDGGDEEQSGALGILGLARTCCVCIEMEQINRCLRSEKICILPILACLLSLALCTAGLKWVFVDKIFEYEPPTHLDPKRIGQGPIIISADPTLGLPVSFSHSSSSAASLTTTITTTTAHPEVLVKEKYTAGPFVPQSPRVTQFTPSVALAYHADQPTQSGIPTIPKQTTNPRTTVEFNDIIIPTISATSTTPAAKTSSHVTHCSNSQKNYCVNGGECFTLEVMPGSTKFLCRCPNEFTGDRCQNYVMASFYKHLGIEFMEAEELYQKRVLTITGICIALLVVGIMCVVAYCKTKKQRKKLHDRLRQSLRNERNNMASLVNRPQTLNCPRENVQLVNQFVSKNSMPMQHVTEKETETSFSTSQNASSAHQSTTVTYISSQSWRNGWSNSGLSESQSVLVMSLAENSQHATPSHRGRLNATSGARDPSAYLNDCRDTPNSYTDSPYSGRYASSVTTLTQLSSMPLAFPATPESPPSEMSAPLSSQATSLPSVAISPSAEEERPLLLATTLQPHNKPSCRDLNQYERNSAHYNHGHEAHSSPPSSLMIMEDDDYQITRDHDTTVDIKVAPASPQNFPVKLANTNNNNNGYSANRPKANGHVGHNVESNGNSMLESETEDEPVGEDTPFLTIENTTDLSVRSVDSRTNSASPNDDLHARLFSATTKQEPVAV